MRWAWAVARLRGRRRGRRAIFEARCAADGGARAAALVVAPRGRASWLPRATGGRVVASTLVDARARITARIPGPPPLLLIVATALVSPRPSPPARLPSARALIRPPPLTSGIVVRFGLPAALASLRVMTAVMVVAPPEPALLASVTSALLVAWLSSVVVTRRDRMRMRTTVVTGVGLPGFRVRCRRLARMRVVGEVDGGRRSLRRGPLCDAGSVFG